MPQSLFSGILAVLTCNVLWLMPLLAQEPRGMRVNYLEAWILRLQSAAPFLSLLPVPPQHFAWRHLWSPHRKLGSDSAR